MFALFNLGLQELIVLAVLGVFALGAVAVVLLVVFLSKGGRGRDESSDE